MSISQNAVAAREAARSKTGEFGHQNHSESGVRLPVPERDSRERVERSLHDLIELPGRIRDEVPGATSLQIEVAGVIFVESEDAVVTELEPGGEAETFVFDQIDQGMWAAPKSGAPLVIDLDETAAAAADALNDYSTDYKDLQPVTDFNSTLANGPVLNLDGVDVRDRGFRGQVLDRVKSSFPFCSDRTAKAIAELSGPALSQTPQEYGQDAVGTFEQINAAFQNSVDQTIQKWQRRRQESFDKHGANGQLSMRKIDEASARGVLQDLNELHRKNVLATMQAVFVYADRQDKTEKAQAAHH